MDSIFFLNFSRFVNIIANNLNSISEDSEIGDGILQTFHKSARKVEEFQEKGFIAKKLTEHEKVIVLDLIGQYRRHLNFEQILAEHQKRQVRILADEYSGLLKKLSDFEDNISLNL
jgi:hypothetical protein